MRIYLPILVIMMTLSCTTQYDVDSYYKSDERDSLLTDIITYVYQHPPQATWENRFDPVYRKYYVAQIPKFRFEKYFVAEDGWHYFYLIRPARSPQGNIRGVGGRFRRSASGTITRFEEIFNTPVGDLVDLRKRGDQMFRWMIRHGHVNEYLKNPDFIEWPNDQSYYDTIQHGWLIRPGI